MFSSSRVFSVFFITFNDHAHFLFCTFSILNLSRSPFSHRFLRSSFLPGRTPESIATFMFASPHCPLKPLDSLSFYKKRYFRHSSRYLSDLIIVSPSPEHLVLSSLSYNGLHISLRILFSNDIIHLVKVHILHS